MPYYNDALEPDLGIRDRLRDLLEANAEVRTLYPSPLLVHDMLARTVSEADLFRVSVMWGGGGAGIAAYDSYTTGPMICITVQRFSSPDESADQGAEATECVNLALVIRRLLLVDYRAEPAPLAASDGQRLWDTVEFPSDASEFGQVPSKFWYVNTYCRLTSSDRR